VNRAPSIAAILPAAAATGCVMPDQLPRFSRMSRMHTRRRHQVSVGDSQKVTELESKVGSGDTVKRSEVADLKAGLDDVVRQTTATADKVDQVNLRVDRLSQDVQAAREAARRLAPPAGAGTAPDAAPAGGAPATGVPAAAAAAGGSIPNPTALYNSSYADFSKGNYALAIQGFEEYAQRFPEADLADNAMYWIGECEFSQGSYKAAVDAFDGMLAKYPGSDKAAAANLKKALSYVQMHQVGEGIEQLRYVVATYPGTDEARIAKDRLATLEKP
jgi:tol-pal system protein YbgF